MQFKVCNTCHEKRSIDSFRPREKWISNKCRICEAATSREYHFSHHDQTLKRMLEYRTKRKSYIREQRRRHYIKHRDEILSRSKKWIKENKERLKAYRKQNYIKVKARQIVNNKIITGQIVKQPCKNCGEIKVHAHHEDYSKPLDVIWLCAPCHSAHHRNLVPLHKL